MKKRLILLVSTVALISLLVVGGTMAWFTSTPDPIENLFTAGTVEIEVNEHGFIDWSNWNPGDTTNKDVSVKSLGSKQTYVRVSLTPEWGEIVEGAFVPSTDPVLATSNVQLNLADNGYWIESEGWYYYKNIMEKDEETSLLLDSVTLLGSATGNEYQGKTLRINVKAEAVQASNNAYVDVWGLTTLPDGVGVWGDPQEAV